MRAYGSIVFFLFVFTMSSGCTYPVREADRAYVDSLVDSSNSLIEAPEIARVLSSVAATDFDHSSDSVGMKNDDGTAVLERMLRAPTKGVICRRAVNPFNSSTNAWEGGGTPQLRCSRLRERSTERWIGTIVHERAHAAGYLHRGNRRAGNECTVPHFVGDLAVYLAANNSGDAMLPHNVCPALRTALDQ